MFQMFKKINSKEKFIGWYVTGDSVRPQDLAVNEVFRKYNPNGVLLVVDVENNVNGDRLRMRLTCPQMLT